MRATKTLLLRIAALATALAALIAVPAFAEPTHSATLDATKTTFAWDGGPETGVSDLSGAGSQLAGRDNLDCGNATYHCDYIKLTLAVPGDLSVVMSEATDESALVDEIAMTDFDLFLYASNAAGEPQGAPIAKQADAAANERVGAAGLPAGDYVAVIEYWWAIQGTYKGLATFTPTAGGGGTGEEKPKEEPKQPGDDEPQEEADEVDNSAQQQSYQQQQQSFEQQEQQRQQEAAQQQGQGAQQPGRANHQLSAPAGRTEKASSKRALKRCRAKARKVNKASKRRAAMRRCARKHKG